MLRMVFPTVQQNQSPLAIVPAFLDCMAKKMEHANREQDRSLEQYISLARTENLPSGEIAHKEFCQSDWVPWLDLIGISLDHWIPWENLTWEYPDIQQFWGMKWILGWPMSTYHLTNIWGWQNPLKPKSVSSTRSSMSCPNFREKLSPSPFSNSMTKWNSCLLTSRRLMLAWTTFLYEPGPIIISREMCW